MTFLYSEFVFSRAKKMPSFQADIIHMAMGLAGESGELIDAVKKSYAYGKVLGVRNIVEELGDIVFYVQGMLNFLGEHYDFVPGTIEELEKLNTEKLTKRYPAGYSDAAAIARADKSGFDTLPDDFETGDY